MQFFIKKTAFSIAKTEQILYNYFVYIYIKTSEVYDMSTTTIIIHVFMLLGGLAFFLFGMNVMSSGLEKLSGGKLQSTLNKATNNTFKSLFLGAGITVAIQSSSALTVMLVGLVNSGIMSLRSTVGVIMGSNIGTTLTAWLTSLTGIESSGPISLLKPSSFSPLLAFIGIVLTMMSKSNKKKESENSKIKQMVSALMLLFRFYYISYVVVHIVPFLILNFQLLFLNV